MQIILGRHLSFPRHLCAHHRLFSCWPISRFIKMQASGPTALTEPFLVLGRSLLWLRRFPSYPTSPIGGDYAHVPYREEYCSGFSRDIWQILAAILLLYACMRPTRSEPRLKRIKARTFPAGYGSYRMLLHCLFWHLKPWSIISGDMGHFSLLSKHHSITSIFPPHWSCAVLFCPANI